MAIMLITHDLGVIAEMATDVAVMYLGRVVEQAPVDAIFHAPKHPYTRALLRSIPRMRARSARATHADRGLGAASVRPPGGLPFHPRCPDFMPGTCDRQTPELRAVGDRHTVSCFLYRMSARQDAAAASGRAAEALSDSQGLPEADGRVTFGRSMASTFTSTRARRWASSGRAAAARPPRRAASCARSSRRRGEIFMRLAGRRRWSSSAGCASRSCGRCGARCR